jgi:hypothetical protein
MIPAIVADVAERLWSIEESLEATNVTQKQIAESPQAHNN